MAIIALDQLFPIFDFGARGSALPSISGAVYPIDAANEAAAQSFQAPKTGQITHIGFVVHTNTVAADLIGSIEANVNGFPSGTPIGGTGTVTSVAGWNQITLSTPADVTANTIYWAKVAQPAVNPGNCIIASVLSIFGASNVLRFPVGAHFTGSWSKGSNRASIFVRYSTGEWVKVVGTYPIISTGNISVSTGTNPALVAQRFQVKAPMRFRGAEAVMGAGGSTRDWIWRLEDGAGSNLSQITFPATALFNTGNGPTSIIMPAATLLPGTTYRLIHEPITAQANTLHFADVHDVAHLSAMPGGAECFMEEWNGSAWVPSNSGKRVLLMSPLIDGIDDASGGGGGGGDNGGLTRFNVGFN